MKRLTVSKAVILLTGLLLLAGCGKTELSDAEYLQKAKNYIQKGDESAAAIELKNALKQNPRNSEARYLLGRRYFKAGNFPAAETAFRRAMQLGMSASEVTAYLAQSLLYQQKFDEALSLLAGAAAGGDDPKLLVLAAEAHLGKSEYDQAQALLVKAGKLAPESYQVHLGLAKLAGARGKTDKAADELRLALKSNPGGAQALRLMGAIALQQGNYSLALEYFDKAISHASETPAPEVLAARLGRVRALLALNRRDEAGHDIDALLKRIPRHPAPLYFHALLAYQAHDFDEAEDYLSRVLKQLPDHPPSLLLLGAINYDRGNYEQAEQYLGQYVAQAGNQPEAVMLLAATRLKMGQADLAMEALRPVVEVTQDAQLLRMIGKVAVMRGDLAGGTAYLKKALASSGDSSSIRVELANVYLNSGAYDDAIKALEPLAIGERDKRARVMLVFAHLRKKDLARALKGARDLVADYPTDPGMLTLLGGVQMAKGDVKDAEQSFQKALKIDNAFIPALRGLAKLHFQQKDYDAADRTLDRILSVDGKNLTAMMGKAQLVERQGDRKAALQWWQKAHDSHPGSVLPALVLAGNAIRTGEPHRALDILGETLARNKDSIPLLLMQGRAQLAAEMPSKALQTYEHLAAMAPDEPSVLMALSGVQMKMNLLDKARQTVERLLKLKPDNMPARIRLIQLDLQAQRYDEAEKLARNIQKDLPESALGYVLAGDIAAQRKQFDEAMRQYRKALDYKTSERILAKLAGVMRQGGQGDAADALLASWLKKHPDEDSLLVKGMLAMAYQAEDKKDRAQALYEEILKSKPDHIIALNNLSYLYLGKDPAKARQYAEQAYRLAKGNPAVQDTLGWALVQEGKEVARGVRLLQEASDRAPGVADIQYHLAAGLAKMGRDKEARKVLAAALSNKSAFKERPAAERLWQQLQ